MARDLKFINLGRNFTFYVAKTRALNCAFVFANVQLICAFVSAYAKNRCFHDAAQFITSEYLVSCAHTKKEAN